MGSGSVLKPQAVVEGAWDTTDREVRLRILTQYITSTVSSALLVLPETQFTNLFLTRERVIIGPGCQCGLLWVGGGARGRGGGE